jgi:hypothetical protein
MTLQKKRKYEGGRKIAEKGGLDQDMVEVADDFATLLAKFNSLLGKLDTEGSLGGGYVTEIGISSFKTVK